MIVVKSEILELALRNRRKDEDLVIRGRHYELYFDVDWQVWREMLNRWGGCKRSAVLPPPLNKH